MNTYEASLVFDPNCTVTVSALTASKARYQAFLEWSDLFEIRFQDIRIRRKHDLPNAYQYIRDYYKVPARVGGKVTYQGVERTICFPNGGPNPCYVYLDFDGRVRPVHPTETGLVYMEGANV